MDEQTHELIRILAAIDAVFCPVRKWDSREHNILKVRYKYPNEGIAVSPKNRSRTAQKRRLRVLNDLAVDGRIIRCQRSSNRTTGYQLTEAGEWSAREFIGVWTPQNALATLLDSTSSVTTRNPSIGTLAAGSPKRFPPARNGEKPWTRRH